MGKLKNLKKVKIALSELVEGTEGEVILSPLSFSDLIEFESQKAKALKEMEDAKGAEFEKQLEVSKKYLDLLKNIIAKFFISGFMLEGEVRTELTAEDLFDLDKESLLFLLAKGSEGSSPKA